MQCIICGANVAEPSEYMEFPQDKSGLCGNFLFSNRNGRTVILNAYCDSHIATARNLFSSVNGKNYADGWDTFDSTKYTWVYPVNSGITRYAYFEKQQALVLDFNEEDLYVYWEVSKDLMTEFKASSCLDTFFLHKIRKVGKKLRPYKTLAVDF